MTDEDVNEGTARAKNRDEVVHTRPLLLSGGERLPRAEVLLGSCEDQQTAWELSTSVCCFSSVFGAHPLVFFFFFFLFSFLFSVFSKAQVFTSLDLFLL
jgi:hypothetical protein